MDTARHTTRQHINDMARRATKNYDRLPVICLSGCIAYNTLYGAPGVSIIVELGENDGLYGWNWTAYLREYTADGLQIPFIAIDNYRGLNLPKIDIEAYSPSGTKSAEILAQALGKLPTII